MLGNGRNARDVGRERRDPHQQRGRGRELRERRQQGRFRAGQERGLDDAEVSGSVFICDGASGPVGGNGANGEAGVSAPAALVEGSSPPVGDANCPAGGLEVKTGIDANRNGVLDAGEFVATFSCNGAATRGDAGPTGGTGAQGDAGATGATGASGLNSLIKLTTEPAGGNCGGGGVKIESGLDSNSNNVLDAGEVTSTAYVCNASLGYFALTGAPTHATVFNATAETYRFGNNLTNSIWNRQSNVIVTGEYSTQGYWAFAESTNNYTAGPNVGTNFHERMVQIPATNTVVFSNAATSAGTGVGAGTASLVMVATISTSTGLLTASPTMKAPAPTSPTPYTMPRAPSWRPTRRRAAGRSTASTSIGR